LPAGFTVARLGRLPHSDVLNQMSLNDVYFYPTNHSGEGHNNSINEAMMSFMVIVTTKKGFLESVLGDSAYFLDKVDDANIYNIVQHILNNKEEAAGKAAKAKKRLTENYTSVKQIPMLNSYYKLASAN
jgi:glycosyltransferase involved in cell wall biosynthesis